MSRNYLLLLTLAVVLTAAAPDERTSPRGTARIVREVRHELVMLPYYGVFDNLAYKVDGYDVTLMGQVTRPTLNSDAENVVKKIEGVEHVKNLIDVLPPSPMDDRIRLAVYRAIYSYPGLDRYALQAVPPIHIIVKNGNVALEGVVATEADRNLAGVRCERCARHLFGQEQSKSREVTAHRPRYC